jgi:DNA-binding Xre family transcriptional regulator
MKLIHAGKCVVAAQHQKGITSAEFAKIAKTSPQQVLRWRTHSNMKLHTIQRVCDALDISLESFITFGYKV